MTNWLKSGWLLLALALPLLPVYSLAASPAKKEKVREEVAVIDTNMGRIVFHFYPKESPQNVEAFKSLVRARFFDGMMFHRVLPGLLIQWGNPQTRESDSNSAPLEGASAAGEKNDLKHHVGTVSIAHPQKDSDGANEFFICIQDVSYFDGKHTVVGEVVAGMKVVEAISQVPRNTKQAPLFPVRIQRIHVEIQEFLKEVR